MQNRRTLFSFIFSVILHLFLFAALLFGFHTVKRNIKKEKIISLRNVKIKQPKKAKKRVVKKKKIKKPKKMIKPKKLPKPKPKKIIKPKPKKVVKPKPKKVIKKIIHKIKKLKKITFKKKLLKKPPIKQISKPLPTITKKQDVNISKKITPPKVVFQKRPIVKEVVVPKVDIKQKFIKLNTDKIIKAINEEKYYPRIARKRHIEGVVRVSFLLKKDGSVIIKEVKTDKRYLGSAAKKTIKKASSYFPKPPKDILFHIPIEFKLD